MSIFLGVDFTRSGKCNIFGKDLQPKHTLNQTALDFGPSINSWPGWWDMSSQESMAYGLPPAHPDGLLLQVTYIFLVEIARWNVPCVCRHSFCCWNLPFLPIRPTYGWHSPFLQVRLMKFPSFNPPFPRRFPKIFHLPLRELHENSIFFPCSPDFTRTAQWLCKICNCFSSDFPKSHGFSNDLPGSQPLLRSPTLRPRGCGKLSLARGFTTSWSSKCRGSICRKLEV